MKTDQVGTKRVELPPGVNVADWELERRSVQNHRIRCYLGCIRMTQEVLDSNYAILHCSPSRLRTIWRQIQSVSHVIQSDLLRNLAQASLFPNLEAARIKALAACELLVKDVLAEIDRYPQHVSSPQLPEIRKLLCVAIGKIHAFLRDSFGEIMGNDPRSRHNPDYFLSRRFIEDIEESEWLYSSVYVLREYLDGVEKVCSAELDQILVELRRENMIPNESAWSQTTNVLQMLEDGLSPKLKSVLSLRGIRFDDLESLDEYAFAIPHYCKALAEVYTAARAAIERIKATAGVTFPEREQSVRDLIVCHAVMSERLINLISKLGVALSELATYLPVWMERIEKRRCLMLSKNPAEIVSPAVRFALEARQE